MTLRMQEVALTCRRDYRLLRRFEHCDYSMLSNQQSEEVLVGIRLIPLHDVIHVLSHSSGHPQGLEHVKESSSVLA